MEEFSENEFFQNIKLCSKITTFAEPTNSRVHVSEDFDTIYNNCDFVEYEFVCYSKKREIMPIKNPKDFSCKTDLILYNRKSSSMYDEKVEKNKEKLIKSGITTDMSSLNTKENITEINSAALRQRSKELSDMAKSGVVARMKALKASGVRKK